MASVTIVIDTEVVVDGTQKSVRLRSSAACVCTCGEKVYKELWITNLEGLVVAGL